MKIINLEEDEIKNTLKVTEKIEEITKDDILKYDEKYFILKETEDFFECAQCDLDRKYSKCINKCYRLIKNYLKIKELNEYEILFNKNINKGCD